MEPEFDHFENLVHRELTSRLEHRLSEQGDLEKVFSDKGRRQEIILRAIADVMAPFGQTWVGAAAPKSDGRALSVTKEFANSLGPLSQALRFITFHVFDVFDGKRSSIASVVSSAAPETRDEAWQKAYQNIERIYVAISSAGPDRKSPPAVPTLVKSLYEHQTPRVPPQPRAFFLVDGKRKAAKNSHISQNKFPMQECLDLRRRMKAKPITAKSRRDDTVNEIWAASGLVADQAIAEPIISILGANITPQRATAMALAFSLWEEIEILPYYFRAYAWSMPSLLRPADLGPDSSVVGVSATLSKSHCLTPRETLLIDALARGIGTATAFFGIQLGRTLLSNAYIPFMLRHEIGGHVGKLVETVDGRSDISAHLKRELHYVRSRLMEIMEYPDLGKLIAPDHLGGLETSSAWPELFYDMCVSDYPDVSRVQLVTSDGTKHSRLRLSRETSLAELSNLTWPPPLKVGRIHLRTILSNLIINANECGPTVIELRIGAEPSPPDYVVVSVQDNSDQPFRPVEGNRLHFGLPIIQRLFKSLAIPYPQSVFLEPAHGSTGKSKVFRLQLPVQSPALSK